MATGKVSPADLDAVVLCGGLGKRLRSAVPEGPKVLAPVGGRAFLDILIEWAMHQGLRRFIFCVGYLGKAVREHVEESSARDVEALFSKEAAPLGTAGALSHALSLIESNPCLVLNGDSLCDVNLAEAWAAYQTWNARALIVVARVPDAGRYGKVERDRFQRVTAFREKDPLAGEGWVSAGVSLLAREVIAAVPTGREISLEHSVYPSLIGNGLYAMETPGPFVDIGTPADYEHAREAVPGWLARWPQPARGR